MKMGYVPDDNELLNGPEDESTDLFSSDEQPSEDDERPAEEPAQPESPKPAEAPAPAPAAADEDAELTVGDMDESDEAAAPDDWIADIGATPQTVKKGDIVKGICVAVDHGGVICDIGAKVEGIIPIAEFASGDPVPEVDSTIEVAVVRIDEANDVILLSKRSADYARCWNELEEAAKVGDVVEAMVTERVKGGLRVDVGVPGFVPASHVATRNLRNLDSFVGRSLRLKVLEADRRQKKVILSHRELVEEERDKRKSETLDQLFENAIVEGKVRNVTNYGAFIDLGGIDGLLHVSEMSWTRIGHPSEVVKVGDKVRVIVLDIADDGERISLGMRQIMPDPWKETAKTLRPGSVVSSKITRLVRTGAFAQLDEAGIEGFIPIREMSDKRIAEPSEALSVGQEVELKILDINVPARRMTLSLVAAQQEKERAEYRDYMKSQETTRPTLGDQFGDVLAALQADEAAEEAEPIAEPVAEIEPEAVEPPEAPSLEPEEAPEADAPDEPEDTE